MTWIILQDELKEDPPSNSEGVEDRSPVDEGSYRSPHRLETMEKRKASSERLEVKLRGITQELANGLPSLEHVGNTIWYGS